MGDLALVHHFLLAVDRININGPVIKDVQWDWLRVCVTLASLWPATWNRLLKLPLVIIYFLNHSQRSFVQFNRLKPAN